MDNSPLRRLVRFGLFPQSLLLQYTFKWGSKAAEDVVGLSGQGKLIVADFAWEFDMLNESVCTGVKSNRKIVFFGKEQSHAFVFVGSTLSMSDFERSKPIRKMNDKDIAARLPVYKGVEKCRYASAS